MNPVYAVAEPAGEFDDPGPAFSREEIYYAIKMDKCESVERRPERKEALQVPWGFSVKFSAKARLSEPKRRQAPERVISRKSFIEKCGYMDLRRGHVANLLQWL